MEKINIDDLVSKIGKISNGRYGNEEKKSLILEYVAQETFELRSEILAITHDGRYSDLTNELDAKEEQNQSLIEEVKRLREGLEKLLAESINVVDCWDRDTFQQEDIEYLRQRNDEAKQLLSSTSKVDDDGWISVEDDLPIGQDDNVLIFAGKKKTGEKIEVAFYNHRDKEWAGLNDFWLPFITHWRPLPTPPKQ